MPTAAIAQPTRPPAHVGAAVTGGIAWIALALAVGATGVLVGAPTPGPQLIIVALTATLVWLTTRGALRPLADAIPVRGLVAFNGLRFAGAIFLILGAQGTLSPLFGTRAGWGDIIAAAGAIALVASGAPTTRTRRVMYLGWNVFATLDLLVAVGTATLVALRGDAPGVAPLFGAPLILVPTFLVPVFLATHLIIFRRLRSSTVDS